jgi:hypothetical protein
MKDTTIQKALERLVTSLVSDVDSELCRLDMVEEAMSYAALALGMSPPDQHHLRDQLDTVAVQLITDKVERENLKVYQVAVTGDRDEHISSVFATADTGLAAELSRIVERHASNGNKKQSQDFSVN